MTVPRQYPRLSIPAVIEAIQRRARAVALTALVLGLFLAHYTAGHLSVDTNTSNMLSPELPWRQTETELARLFPAGGNLVLVVDGDTPELADAAQIALVQKLRARDDLFAEVFALEAEPYFRRNGLLYLEPDALQKLAEDLTLAQPFLGALDRDPSLHGLFTLLTRAAQTPAAASFDMSAALAKLAEAVGAVAEGRFYSLSWQQLMGANAGAGPAPGKRRFIELTAVQDFTRLLPSAAPIAAVRASAGELQLDAAHGVRVRLTGNAALEHEELLSVFTGMGWVLASALLLVAVLLVLALRSLRLVLAAVVTLVYGLLLTAAFAAAAVGHLNLISIAFGVLYVGLGIDYALYLCMQYRERLGEGLPALQALPRAAQDVGGYMLVCALTTSLGFFAFVPTSFTGIAELGLISGVGMFISLLVSLTLLPALITLFPPHVNAGLGLRGAGAGRSRILEWPYREARAIWWGAALLGLAALFLAPRARFDYDPLNLRNPQSESVSTFRDLLADPNIPALSLSAVAGDAASARSLAQKFSALPLVARALSLGDFIPAQQEEKLALIEDLAMNLALSGASGTSDAYAARASDGPALQELEQALPVLIQRLQGAQAVAAQNLLDQLKKFSAACAQRGEAGKKQLLDGLRRALLAALPAHLAALRLALQAQPVTEADLPPQLVRRWKSADGHFRVEVWPREVLDNPAAMERFIAQARSVAPQVSGPPVGFVESGHAVVRAFRIAFVSSLAAITLLLLVLLRSWQDTLLVLIPLVMAGLLTLAGMVLLDVPFNFANVIALPLVLGVGVDYGVYLVQRGRDVSAAGVNLLQTSTARAVLFGALITMANFGDLMLARHPGMVSMGVLLTVGLGMTLLCALVLLPSLLARRTGTKA